MPQFCKDFKCWLHLDSYEINHNLYEHSSSQCISWSTHLYLTINSSRSGFTLCSMLGQCALAEWLFGLLPMCVPFVRWSYSFGLYGFLVEWGWGIVFGVCLAHFNSIHTTPPPPHNESPTYMKFKCDGTIGPSPPFLTMCTITHLSFHVTFLSSIIMLHVKVKRAQPIHPQLFIQL